MKRIRGICSILSIKWQALFGFVLPITLLVLFIDYVWAWLLDFPGPAEIFLAASAIQARSYSVSIETSEESLSPGNLSPPCSGIPFPNTT
jgi:hypothetical protein